MANCYDGQLYLEVTGPGGSGKSITAEIATMLAGGDNVVGAYIEMLVSLRTLCIEWLLADTFSRIGEMERGWCMLKGHYRRGCGVCQSEAQVR